MNLVGYVLPPDVRAVLRDPLIRKRCISSKIKTHEIVQATAVQLMLFRNQDETIETKHLID
jgi:hypothetical protein